MRIGLLPVVMIMCLAGVSYAEPVKGQEVLKKKISISADQEVMKNILKQIGKKAEVKFVYISSNIPDRNKTTIVANNEELGSVLYKLLNPFNIQYEVNDDQIVLKPDTPSTFVKEPGNQVAEQRQEVKDPITGKIADDKGNPLSGVSVTVKGTVKGTSTNANGVFNIDANPGDVLEFTMVGYKSHTVVIGNNRSLSVQLQTAAAELGDVVVVAYGSTTKRKITSSVTTLSMENVARLPVQSVSDGLAGRLNGVIVTSTTGAPGAKAGISIRGGGAPLYVIDNAIRSQNDFQNLNPNDIESFSILKDAAATSLYGAQGGNGVVLITTKKGTAGQVNINYSFNQIWSQPTVFPKKVGSYEYLNAINQVYIAEGRQQPTADSALNYYRNQTKPFLYPDIDWQNIAMKDFAPENRHDLSLSAGNKLLTYYASGSYYHQGTNLRTKNNYNDRITYRLKTVSDFDNVNLKVTTGLDGYVETNSVPNSATGGSYAAIFQHVQQKSPAQLAVNEFGLPYNVPDNPVIELSPLSGYSRGTSRVLNSVLAFEYTAPFLKGLRLKANGNYNMWNSMNKSWNASAPSYLLNSTSPIMGNPPSLGASRGDGSAMVLQAFVAYNNKFGNHNIDFTGGYEQTNAKSSSLSAGRSQYQIIFDQFVAGPTVNQTSGGSESESASAGYLSRLSYSYGTKYFLEGTVRYDGNDLLPGGKQWGTFYAVSAGWALSEEQFMKVLKDRHYMDFLKLRASDGLTGILSGIGAFQYVPGYNVNANAWVINGQPVQGTSEPGSLPSVNFSWYSIRSKNVGLDFATLNNRLSISADYFYMRTTGYVTGDTRYAAPLGIGLPPVNFKDAALRREGYEFNVTWNDKIVKDFNYKVGVNFTYFNQLWERNPNELVADLKNPYTRASGAETLALTTGLTSDGYYTKNSDLLSGPRRIASINVVGGDLKYVDTNGDGKIDGADNRRIGSSDFPRINYGTTIDLDYKGAFLSAVVMGSGNRDRYFGSIMQGGSLQNLLMYRFQQDYWRPDNTDAKYPRQVSTPGVNGSHNYQTSDFWILRSQFIRLKYLQLGYNFKPLMKNAPFKQLRAFVSGTNLLTSSKTMDYFIDPESNQNNEGYPIQRTIAVGVNVGF